MTALVLLAALLAALTVIARMRRELSRVDRLLELHRRAQADRLPENVVWLRVRR